MRGGGGGQLWKNGKVLAWIAYQLHMTPAGFLGETARGSVMRHDLAHGEMPRIHTNTPISCEGLENLEVWVSLEVP